MVDLRSCPFCGGEPTVLERDFRVEIVKCKECSCESFKEHWNNRPQLGEAVEALEEISCVVQEYGEEVTIWDLVSITQEALSEIGGDCDE